MPFLLIIAGASKQHKRMPQKVFHANIKALGCFLGMVCVRFIRGFPRFPVDPYYEPLAWFMIAITKSTVCFDILTFIVMFQNLKLKFQVYV